MAVYYSVLAGLSAAGACLCWKSRSRLKDGVFVLLAFVVLAGLSAIRYDVGTDYGYIYGPIYEKILADPTGAVLAGSRWEPGFKLLLKAIMFFSQNYHMLFVVTSILNVGLVLLFFWLYSPNVFVSVFLYVSLSQYYCSMNFLRQMLAAAIALYALPLLMKKRSVPGAAAYFLIVLLAASFHKSALIMIPFYFISLIPLNKYVLTAYLAVTTLIYFNSQVIVDFVTRYWYSSYRNNVHMVATFEMPFTVIRAGLFLITLLCAGMLKKAGRQNTMLLTYAFFDFFFVLMGSRHSILDRLSMYFRLATPIAMAIIIHQAARDMEESRGRRVGTSRQRSLAVFAGLFAVVFGGSLAAHQYALTMDHHGVVPYKIIFNQPFYAEYVRSLEGGPAQEPILEEPEEDPFDFLLSAPMPEEEPSQPAMELPAQELSGEATEQPQPKEGAPGEVTLEEFMARYQ